MIVSKHSIYIRNKCDWGKVNLRQFDKRIDVRVSPIVGYEEREKGKLQIVDQEIEYNRKILVGELMEAEEWIPTFETTVIAFTHVYHHFVA